MKGNKIMENKFFEDLNDRQREAVECVDGNIQVIAIAGAGKTKVLTNRTANMIINHKINPNNILVATFTKKAADEMKDRLKGLISKNDIDNLLLGTFHSIGYRILKQEYMILGNKLKNATLLQGNAAIWLLEEAMKNIVTKKQIESGAYEPGIILSKISSYKMDLKTADDILILANLSGEVLDEYEENVLKIYREYEKLKDLKCHLDFDDMLFKTYKLFVENPKILNKYQNLIQYLLIDEAQDNNRAQYELVKMLGEPQNNIFIVGDDDQSIYGFRGAKPEEFINFENNYDDVKRINLELNYRSTQSILDASDNLIKNNKNRIVKKLISGVNDTKSNLPNYIVTNDEEQEGLVIADKILNITNNQIENIKNKDFKDISIIYRTNAQARALEDALLINSIPYTILNGTSFYERSEIKDIVAYLNLAFDKKDNKSLERIINKPSRYIGKAFMNQLKEIAKSKRCCLYDALSYCKVSPGIMKNVENFKFIIEKTSSDIKNNKNLSSTIEKLIERLEYKKYLSSNEENEKDNSKIENLYSLMKATDNYATCKDFLKFVNESYLKVKKENSNSVKLMTIHKSKGLEFPIVFLAGVSNDILPNKRAVVDNPTKGLEEERRLAYVGMTRAKEYLLVTSPSSYQSKYKGLSNFILEAKLNEEVNIFNKKETNESEILQLV